MEFLRALCNLIFASCTNFRINPRVTRDSAAQKTEGDVTTPASGLSKEKNFYLFDRENPRSPIS